MKRLIALLLLAVTTIAAYPQTQKVTTKKIGITEVTAVEEAKINAKYPPHYKGQYKLPIFRDGWYFQKYKKWVVSNITYPEGCLRDRIEGKVIVAFIIDKDGVVRNAEVVESPDPRMGAELLRVVKSGVWAKPAQKWNSAEEKYETVGMRSVIPIVFNLPPEDPTAPKSLTYGMMKGDFTFQ